MRHPHVPLGRILVLTLAGLGVLALAAGAGWLSYAPFRALAEAGGVPAKLSFLYPAGVDVLTGVALLAVAVLWSRRAAVRLQAWLILWLLLLTAAGGSVYHAVIHKEPTLVMTVVMAGGPWLLLLLGFWLWMLLVRHARSLSRDQGDLRILPDARAEGDAGYRDGDLLVSEPDPPRAEPAPKAAPAAEEEPASASDPEKEPAAEEPDEGPEPEFRAPELRIPELSVPELDLPKRRSPYTPPTPPSDRLRSSPEPPDDPTPP